MEALRPTTVLRRANDLELRLTAAGDTLVVTERGLVSGGPHCLAILDAFSVPTTLAEALERLGPRAGGAQDWIDLTAAVGRFHDEGVLRVDGDLDESAHVVRQTFDSPGPHIAMLEDRVRTSAFLAALDEVIGADDVVIDIGTGTGVLAVGAARAGARHVYAIEATPLAEHAREVVRANGVADRVTIVEGWSTRVRLPERAGVAVAEILGSDALEERVLPVLLDARKRLLAPDARLIPSVIRIFAQPVSIPAERINSIVFTPWNTAQWGSWYGLEFGPLADYSARLRQRFTATLDDARGWPVFSDPVLLAELALTEIETLRVDVVARATATSSGEANGAVAFFEAQLAPGVVISTNPANEPAVTSWGVPTWLLPEPVMLRQGSGFTLEYAYAGAAGGRVRLVA